MKGLVKLNNFYITTLASDLGTEDSGSIEVSEKNKDGYTIVDGEYLFFVILNLTNKNTREILRIYKVEGTKLFFDKRISLQGVHTHDKGTSVQINDFSEVLNLFSNNIDFFGYSEIISDTKVKVYGGKISINQSIVEVPTEEIEIENEGLNYIYYSNSDKKFNISNTKDNIKNIIAEVYFFSGVISSLSDLRAFSLGDIFSSDLFEESDGNIVLKDSSVTTSKIADLAITTDKLADLSVTRSKISNNAINMDKIEYAGFLYDSIQKAALIKVNLSAGSYFGGDGKYHLMSQVDQTLIDQNNREDGSVLVWNQAIGMLTYAKFPTSSLSEISDVTFNENDLLNSFLTPFDYYKLEYDEDEYLEKVSLSNGDVYKIRYDENGYLYNTSTTIADTTRIDVTFLENDITITFNAFIKAGTYNVNFGDGTVVSETILEDSEISIDHTYSSGGNYTISIFTTDTHGFNTFVLGSKENNQYVTGLKLSEDVSLLGDNCFYGSNISNELIIPKLLTSIGVNAFRDNSLTLIEMPNSITEIMDSAFENNNISELILSGSLQIIGNRSFANNNLTSIIPSSSITSIGDEAFISNKLNYITITNSVTYIGNGAFKSNNIASLELGSKVIHIGDSAFEDNEIQLITFPNTLNDIGSNAFKDNNITTLTLVNSITNVGVGAFENNNITAVVLSTGLTSIEDRVFINNNIANVSIPNNITSIGESAFEGNKLTTVSFPTALTYIGKDSFKNNSLNNIRINSLLTMGEGSFIEQNSSGGKVYGNLNTKTSYHNETYFDVESLPDWYYVADVSYSIDEVQSGSSVTCTVTLPGQKFSSVGTIEKSGSTVNLGTPTIDSAGRVVFTVTGVSMGITNLTLKGFKLDNGSLFNQKTAKPFKSYVSTVVRITGTQSFTVPNYVTSIDYIVVAGGGAGGKAAYYGAGGGGAGGLVQGTMNVTSGATLSCTVGNGGGGSTSNSNGANGGDSVFNGVTAHGGGGGAGSTSGDGVAGGCGGGAGGYNGGSGGAGSQGYAGGSGGNNSSCGGGGMGWTGGQPNGGAGLSTWAGTFSSGGSGKGAANGAANTGNGGGGLVNNGYSYPAGSGGSGIICLRYKRVV